MKTKIQTLLIALLLALPVAAQAQFTYTTNNGAITITGYSGSGGDVTIPDTINGLPVINIEDGAFIDCYGLTSVMIPDSVTSIGDDTFFNCFNLTNVMIGNSVTNIGVEAFAYCINLTNVTIGNGITSISDYAFLACNNLADVHFKGNAPSVDWTVFASFGDGQTPTTVFYLLGATGWGSFFAGPFFDAEFSSPGRPTALWLPQVQTGDGNFGVKNNQFGFNISWASGQTVVVEACTNLSNPVWQPIQTNTLTSDSVHFSDPQWTNFPARFYRLCSP